MDRPTTKRTQLHPICNIVVAGETGVGKSSLINLIIGQNCCNTSNDALGVTTKTEYHYWFSESSGQMFRLWDTPGLSEGSFGTVSPKQAQEALRSLLTELKKGGGVHLLILCMRGLPRVTKGMKQTYDTIVGIRDKISSGIPLVAVVTELERQSAPPDIIASMEDWWIDNLSTIDGFQMMFSSHACITTVPDDCYPKLPGRRSLCQGLVRELIVDNASPKLVRNIIIAGETGVGKSSLVNLALGVDRAPVGNDINLVTLSTAHYNWEVSKQAFRLWDTLGFREGLQGGGGLQKRAQEGLRSLFADLSAQGGVHLLIICIRGVSKAAAATMRTYDHIIKIRDKYCPDTPVVAVITELERHSTTIASNPVHSMEQWWKTKSTILYGNVIFAGQACVTCLPDDCEPPIVGRRDACQTLVRELIMQRSLHPQTEPPKDLNVLLFGETGVGKSSLVNLLAGWQMASVSSDSKPCTLTAEEYQFQFGGATIRLWDTVGLEEPENRDEGKEGYFGAIEKAVALIKRLNCAGGISLFLFCIRGSRITQTMQSNYRLFYEVLGKKQVPIAFAVTHLERETGDTMEGWWQRNVRQFEQMGMRSAAHACVTTLKTHLRYAESREAMQVLMSSFDEQGKFSMPPEAWMGRFIKGLGSLIERNSSRGMELVNVLTKRCFLELDTAQRVAAYIDAKG